MLSDQAIREDKGYVYTYYQYETNDRQKISLTNRISVCRVIVSESGSGSDGSGRDPGLNTSGETIDDGVHYYDAYISKTAVP